MNTVVFDSSTLITLTVSCNVWILDRLKGQAEFLIPDAVWEETVGKSLRIDRFRLEGVRLNRLVKLGVIKKVSDPKVKQISERIVSLANNAFFVNGKAIDVIHKGEAEMIALAVVKNTPYVAIDERTTRVLIEKPEIQKDILEGKLHTKIRVDFKKINQLKGITKDLKVIRSVDLLLYAYEKGLFDVDEEQKVNLVRGLVWTAREKGCALSNSEVSSYINMYSKSKK